MTAINENGQVYWTFEDLDLQGEVVSIQKQYDFYRQCISETRSERAKKAYIKRASMLLDIRENIYKLMGSEN